MVVPKMLCPPPHMDPDCSSGLDLLGLFVCELVTLKEVVAC